MRIAKQQQVDTKWARPLGHSGDPWGMIVWYMPKFNREAVFSSKGLMKRKGKRMYNCVSGGLEKANPE